jgi:predicted nucleic acid-binding OB-fold protein
MRKLNDFEQSALDVLRREGSVLVSSDDLQPVARETLTRILDSLVKKKRAVVEATDAGPRYHAL